MSSSIAVLILFIVTLVAANIPFLTDRVFLVLNADSNKSFWLRFSEWFLLYFIILAVAAGLETKLHGQAYITYWKIFDFSKLGDATLATFFGLLWDSFILSDYWEFYAITLCLFTVFALPGFIYHYDLKKHLK